ncbi:MAG: divergent polysaccharide deacetylase family protein [Acidobacteriota bacterium]
MPPSPKRRSGKKAEPKPRRARRSKGRPRRSVAGFSLFLAPILAAIAVGIVALELRRGSASPVGRYLARAGFDYQAYRARSLHDDLGRALGSLAPGTVTAREKQGDGIVWKVWPSGRAPVEPQVREIDRTLRAVASRQGASIWKNGGADATPVYEIALPEGSRVEVQVAGSGGAARAAPERAAKLSIPDKTIRGAFSEFEEEVADGHDAPQLQTPAAAELSRRSTSWKPRLRRRRPRSAPPERPEAAGPAVAIIVDDLGDHPELIPVALAIHSPLTFAVIPELSASRECAEKLHAAGHQILLHLPMEPLSYPRHDPGPLGIFRKMKPEEIEALTRRALADVPEAAGVNNHMGSAATRDARVLHIVLGVIRERGLFFVDSRTAASSIAYRVAREMRVPSAERHVFLDREDFDPEFTHRQLALLFDTARRDGQAIGIGHWNPNTLGVLAADVPGLSRAGVTVVPAGDLVK